jgi:phage-related protein
MTELWKILFYRSPAREQPVQKFIDSLDLLSQSKIYNSLELLKEFNIHLGLPHVKKLTGTNLWELRILGSKSIRIFYITMSGKTILILHAFKKKQQKTPPNELKTAQKRMIEYQSRN